ncbi:hypothetical protein LQ948_15305 [Jiella sp. MQZ9-1]|uniref:Holin-X, holin superfamily III n=1 Tax=Jiella flava TaxID=2816857 RepID=A0A939G1D2_9HYPH|nr:hypothetical protein [Jiella flava]MBO0664001.1 hypothetical protein [Jiella flava]MCD2472572.1 hypothetical protein [Jiella flava]
MIWQLVAKLVTGEAGVYVARLRKLLMLYAVMAVLAILMIGYLLSALYVWLAGIYGPLWTSLGFAGVLLVLIILTYIATIVVRRPARKRADDRLQRDIASIAGVAALSNAPLLFQSAKRNKKLLAIPVAGAVGWAVWRAIATYRSQDRGGY